MASPTLPHRSVPRRRRTGSFEHNSSQPTTPTYSRRSSSNANPYSPTTPRSSRRGTTNSLDEEEGDGSSFLLRRSSTLSRDPVTPGLEGGPGEMGLGSLADELAAMDAEDGDDTQAIQTPTSPRSPRSTRSLSYRSQPGGNLSPTMATKKATKGHARRPTQTSAYDGSDYGDSDDLEEAEGISPSLERVMADVESLARRGVEENGSSMDDVVKRVIHELKDLGGQAGVEANATRLSTAHNSLSIHLANQTRTIASLSQMLLSPLSLPPPPDVIDDLLAVLAPFFPPQPTSPLATTTTNNEVAQAITTDTAQSLAPRVSLYIPSPHSLSALHNLQTSTTSLIATLTTLTDSLQLARQSTNLASRHLRTTTTMLADIRREAELKEEGLRWIERGQWDQKLASRYCARECEGVVGGFEALCNGWRERLSAGGA